MSNAIENQLTSRKEYAADFADYFLPTHIYKSSDANALHRARLSVLIACTLIFMASFYAIIYSMITSAFCVTVLIVAICSAIVSLFLMKRTGSSFMTGNIISAIFFFTVTSLAFRLGGQDSYMLAWYAMVPITALSTAGWRSSLFWGMLSVVSLLVFFLLAANGYHFKDDFVPEYYQLLAALSQVGMVVLLLGLFVLYECNQNSLRLLIEENQRHYNSVLTKSRDAAEVANRAKSEFLANMSHEIRTPMTAILGFCDLLASEIDDPKQVEFIKTIKRNGNYLINIINDILDLSKVEAGKMEMELLPCSPCQILSEVISLMQVRASEKNLPILLRFDGPMPESIVSDPTRLRQILINLTGNAIKFTEKGSVQLVARLLDIESDEPKLQFEVIDSGIGMSSKQLDNLFEPFQQLDNSITRKYGGTGLGLMISKRLTQKLGGDITVKSVPGKGSTFTVAINITPFEATQLIECPTKIAMNGTPVQEKTSPKRLLSDTKLNCRVLLAEDGPDNQRLVTLLLEKAGAEVTIAENGEIALALALREQKKGTAFDVILMDMQMPIMDGYTATRQLRSQNYTGPIIALTAHTMKADRSKCLEVGCDDYLSKPIKPNKLISSIAGYGPALQNRP